MDENDCFAVVARSGDRAWPRPAPLLLALLPAWSALGLAVAVGRAPMAWWVVAGLALAALAALDQVRLLRRPTPDVLRRTADDDDPVERVVVANANQLAPQSQLHAAATDAVVRRCRP